MTMDHISRRTAEVLQQKRAERERERLRKKYGTSPSSRMGASNIYKPGNRSPLLPTTSKLLSTTSSPISSSQDPSERRNSTDHLLDDEQRLADLDRPIIDLSSRSEDKIKEILKEMNRRYRQSMINNVIFDNEKQALTYNTDYLKDQVQAKQQAEKCLEIESKKWNHEIEEQKRAQFLLDVEIERCRDMLKDRDQLIQDNGLVILEDTEKGESKSILSEETVDALGLTSMVQLDEKMKRIIAENRELSSEVGSTRDLLEAVRNANYYRSRKPYISPVSKSPSPQLSQITVSNIQREVEQAKSDHDLKIQRCDMKLSSLFTQIQRLEKQMLGYKQTYDASSKVNSRLTEEIEELRDQIRTGKESKDGLESEVYNLEELEKARQKRLARLKR